MSEPWIRAYLDLFPERATGPVRFAVLDCETTGLNPRKDRIITIGAVAVVEGEILLEDCFERLIEIEFNSSAVTVHGITREESRAGVAEPEALRELLAWLGDAVIVGHHIAHDIESINAGCERHWGFRLRNRSLDTMDLTLLLERDGAFAGEEATTQFSLDGLCARFGIIPHDRHTAAGDAFLTALVFQRLLSLGRRHGRSTLEALLEPYHPED